jgi:hypothetical protein
MSRAWLVALIIIGCGKAATVDKPGGNPQNGSSMTKSESKAAFQRGVAVTPKDALIKWLDGQTRNGEPRLVRLPLVVPNVDGMYDISKARIGAAPDGVELYANDAALGVGLADRAMSTCKQGDCGFLVEGYWRGTQGPGFQFDVNKAEPLSPDRLQATAFVEVEGESGN